MELLGRIKIVVGILGCGMASAWAGGASWEDAPPSLLYYLPQVSGKSFGEIVQETRPLEASGEAFDFSGEVAGLRAMLPGATPEALRGRIDHLLKLARRDYDGPLEVNFLHDIRDLVTTPGIERDAMAEYFNFRLGFRFQPFSYREADKQAFEEKVVELTRRVDGTVGVLRAQYLYLRGAFAFKNGNDTASYEDFVTVVDEYPWTSRAETALFMQGRCLISQGRGRWGRLKNDVDAVDPIPVLEQYLTTYPSGRFVVDVYGWLGAANFDNGRYSQALDYYVRQSVVQGHPEVLDSSVFMIERCLGQIAGTEDPGAVEVVADHPEVAMALAYLLVRSSVEQMSQNDEHSVQNEWREKLLPLLAGAVAEREELYQGKGWNARTMALLAQAASEAGEQDEARRLIHLAKGDWDESDDLLFIDGIVRQRSGDAVGAADAFGKLIRKFPDSALLDGAQLRRATALQDAGRSDEALVELFTLSSEIGGWGNERPQVTYFIETLLNLAPLLELERLAESGEAEEDLAALLDVTLMQRHLKNGDFGKAGKWANPVGRASLEEIQRMASKDQSPQTFLEVGDALAEARGTLLYDPFYENSYLGMFLNGSPEETRKENATALGLMDGMEQWLLGFDELRIAVRFWEKAREDEALEAVATSHILDALPKIASSSNYALQQAKEDGWGEWSRELYDRLQEISLDSEMAKQAVWISPVSSFSEYLRAPRVGYVRHREFFAKSFIENPRSQGRVGWTQRDRIAGGWDSIVTELLSLPDTVSEDLEEERERVARLKTVAYAFYGGMERAFLRNCLDDLDLFLNSGERTPEQCRTYYELRCRCLQTACEGYWDTPQVRWGKMSNKEVLAAIRGALKTEDSKGIEDFVAFLELAVLSNDIVRYDLPDDEDSAESSYLDRDYVQLEEKATVFLEKFPESVKREATRLLQVRAAFRARRPIWYSVELDWPEYPGMDGGLLRREGEGHLPWDAAHVNAVIQEAETEFPKGRYQWEVLEIKARAARVNHDWKLSLDSGRALLGQDESPELHQEALVLIANVFAELADPEIRPELLEVIWGDWHQFQLLEEHLKGLEKDNWEWSPLLLIKDYLLERQQ